jgi:hypothetical protein
LDDGEFVARRRSCSRARLLAPLSLIAAMALGPWAWAEAPAGQRRGKPFWEALSRECAIPAGESAFGLMSEAVGLLGLPESEWRDDVGYGAVAACVGKGRVLSAEERRLLVGRLRENLRAGIGEAGTDSVLLRSFSALELSIFAALENVDPALEPSDWRRLLFAALEYLRDERDLRGLDPTAGWIHATAHTADLLKSLVRNRNLAPADHARILDAIADKLTRAGTPVFTHAEEERLAAVVAAMVRRADFEPSTLETWLARFAALEQAVWRSNPPDGRTLGAAQNARSLLRCLYVELCLPPPASGPAVAGEHAAALAAARERVLATLAAIRR